MGIDGIFLHFLTKEIAGFAVGARVDKVYQPTKFELVFSLRTRTAQKKLFISVGGNYPRLHLSEYSVENPAKPPMLCMLLRKQLTGAIITGVEQVGLDRIVRISFDAANEIGDRVKRVLVIEIMAQYSNLILLDEENVIIDSVKRVDETKSSVREILPRVHYVLPPSQNKLSLLTSSAEEVCEAILTKRTKQLSSAILSTVEGVSPLTAGELAYRVTLDDCEVSGLSSMMMERLHTELSELQRRLQSDTASVYYYKDRDGTTNDFSYFPLTKTAVNCTQYMCDSFSAFLDSFCFGREKFYRTRNKADDLFKTIGQLTERTARKLLLRKEELQACADKETKRIYAELINANLYALEKGALYYDLPNYYNSYNLVRIPALPHLSPAGNAQRYYKEYRKAHTAETMLKDLIEGCEKELEYLRSVEDELSRAETEKEIAEIRTELAESGYVKKHTNEKKNVKPIPFSEFISPNGYKILVGKNNTQNDKLTFKLAAKTDYWFHAQKAPGSHVILCTEREAVKPEDMEFAASLAARFSSIADKGAVEVDYTLIKNIKKPPASPPGFVIYHVYNSMLVAPFSENQSEDMP